MVFDADRLARLERDGAVDLIETFSSIQGEGPRVGERHLFVRFVHCDIHCAYCDTPLCHAPRAEASVELEAGAGRSESLANPVPLAELERIVVRALEQVPHAAVSLTGGEPLLHPWAIEALAPAIRSLGVAVLLETDGNLPEVFQRVQRSIDVLSLDWKLPSATREPDRSDAHARMLAAATEAGIEAYSKAVFVAETPTEEILNAARRAAEVAPDAPFVLQPATPFRYVKTAPSAERAAELHAAASRLHRRVRLIPQVHKALALP